MTTVEEKFAEVWAAEIKEYFSDRMARFMSLVDKDEDTGCWNWTASADSDRYGRFSVLGRVDRAHRISYRFYIGKIPDGLQIDHLCRNRACVNPLHLEAVSQQENIARGDAGSATRRRALLITECPKGHPYDEKNTYIDRRGSRNCRACKRRAAA